MPAGEGKAVVAPPAAAPFTKAPEDGARPAPSSLYLPMMSDCSFFADLKPNEQTRQLKYRKKYIYEKDCLQKAEKASAREIIIFYVQRIYI